MSRTIRFLCPACGRETKLAAGFVCAQEAELRPHPVPPPDLECHRCHPG